MRNPIKKWVSDAVERSIARLVKDKKIRIEGYHETVGGALVPMSWEDRKPLSEIVSDIRGERDPLWVKDEDPLALHPTEGEDA